MLNYLLLVINTMIIDFHTHLGKGDPWYKNTEREEEIYAKKAEDLIKDMNKNNVSFCVVNPNPRIPSRLISACFELANMIKNYKSKLIGFAWLDPRIDESVDILVKMVRENGFKGLKLHPVLNGYYPNNKVTFPLIEAAIKLNIPIYIHSGWGELGSVKYIAVLADNFPDAKIVIGHMVEEKCLDIAKKHENVYIETSYTTYDKSLKAGIKKIEKAVNFVGSSKLVYGSDWPLGGGMKNEIRKIKLSRIKEDEKEKILFKNALKILGMKI
jgi:hypothetical protein